jgi:Bacterial SH3 domain/CARDB
MTHYYVEFRRLNDDLTPLEDDAPWFPALYGDTAVSDGELGRWNTALIQDGLYELRLSISIENSNPRYIMVSPLRVENDIPPFLVTPSPTIRPTSALPTLFPTPTALGANPRGTLRPTQTGLESGARVTAVVDANIRAGDATIFPIVGVLFTGESAQVLGLSSTGTGWYLVRAPNGTEGWIAPSAVDPSGDFSTVAFIQPPATPTFTPIPPTATPANVPDLLINGFRFDPLAPACGQAFSIFMNVTNIGAGTSLISGSVVVQDILVSNNQVIATGAGTFGTIAVGANFVVVVPMFVNAAPNQAHRIVVTLDSAVQVAESNETNNTFTQDYTLAQGSCP